MKKNIKKTPEGTRDLLFEECTACSAASGMIEGIFKSKGYHEVITPYIEFYDIFSMESSGINQESMYTLTDHKGRLLVLRPDATLPIARLCATRLQSNLRPIRLYYNQRVYRNNPTLTGKSNETLQAGIELLGAGGKRADLEVITTAIQILQKVTPDFRVEIGHAGFFKAVASELDVSDELKEEIRVSIELKDYADLNRILDGLKQTNAVNAMRRLPRLFGSESVFEEALGLSVSEECDKALNYLKDLYISLKNYCKNGNIIIDLGLVQRNDYYSDIIFSGYIHGTGEAVLSGGRYDKLLDSFDFPMPAAGFGVNVDEIAKILLSSGAYKNTECASVLVHGDEGFEVEAVNLAADLNEKGISAEISVFESLSDAKKYAGDNAIKTVYSVGKTVNSFDITGESI